MPRPIALATWLMSMVVLAMPLGLHAQKGGAGTGAGSSTGSRPPLPPPAPGSKFPTYSGGNPIYIPGSSANYPVSSGPPIDSMLARLLKQERQKQVVRDTDRLVALTAQYQAEVKATGPTTATNKQLKTIEKLAHEVRTTLMQ
ncbi:hypothetical protein [Terriglobus sp.]|uniref:hypothetical protein n=1 Tax=Terriglobus sp. TaxID=1889013 RepID=UPI003B009850